jgi:hypothetical protein
MQSIIYLALYFINIDLISVFTYIDNIKYIKMKDTKELNFKFMICNQNTGPPAYIPYYINIILLVFNNR